MNNMRDAISNSGNAELKEKYESWKVIKKQLSDELQLPVDKRSKEFDNMNTQAEMLEKEIVRLSSDYASVRKIHVYKLGRCQE